MNEKERALLAAARKYKAAHAEEMAAYDEWRAIKKSTAKAKAAEKAKAYDDTVACRRFATDVFDELMKAVSELDDSV